MPLLIGIDLGTTKTTAIAVATATGRIEAASTAATSGNITGSRDRERGRSEWDARLLLDAGVACLRQLVERLGDRKREIAGIGITGQQHGMVVVDESRRPLTPFINWQDQRGHEPDEATGQTAVQSARHRIGDAAIKRTGCRINSGFLGLSLFWMRQHQQLPAESTACFLMDLFAAELTGGRVTTEPTCAGSGGVFDVTRRQWDEESIRALELPLSLFPEVREAVQPAGRLNAGMAERTGLPEGLPVSPGIGDHQASFLGSVNDRQETVLINVGTGAQVAVFTESLRFEPPIELRPFPVAGNLLSNVGLTGGWQFQMVEQFFRRVGVELFGVESDAPLFARLTELAAQAEPESSGLLCVPTFSGTRSNPDQRGSLTGISTTNLTPACVVRSVIEGMARNYRDAWEQILAVAPRRQTRLAGAGNGLRENRVLTESVRRCFGLEPHAAEHREEAAFGAALIGGLCAGVFSSLDEASRLIRTAPISR